MTGWLDDVYFTESQHGERVREKVVGSPYYGHDESAWQAITRRLLEVQPLPGPALVNAALSSWDDIFDSSLGPARIGLDIFPTPQIMGFLLHELIPLHISKEYDGWHRDARASEHDLVCEDDPSKSIEIKTSSHRTQVFGNRSFGQENVSVEKKAKSGYYCTVNFEGWKTRAGGRPEILRVRYGWVDSTDWVAQTAATGQQSSLPGRVYRNQLAVVYERV